MPLAPEWDGRLPWASKGQPIVLTDGGESTSNEVVRPFSHEQAAQLA
jgi:hypothetical protein